MYLSKKQITITVSVITIIISMMIVTFTIFSTSAQGDTTDDTWIPMIYLTLQANGEDIHGTPIDCACTPFEEEFAIPVYSFQEGVSTQREASSGLLLGKRQYSPVKLIKEMDKSSPLIARALTNNEVIEAEFHFWRPSAIDGTMEHFYSIILTNARISSIRTFTVRSSDLVQQFQEVAIFFISIEWTDIISGITHIDDIVCQAC